MSLQLVTASAAVNPASAAEPAGHRLLPPPPKPLKPVGLPRSVRIRNNALVGKMPDFSPAEVAQKLADLYSCFGKSIFIDKPLDKFFSVPPRASRSIHRRLNIGMPETIDKACKVLGLVLSVAQTKDIQNIATTLFNSCMTRPHREDAPEYQHFNFKSQVFRPLPKMHWFVSKEKAVVYLKVPKPAKNADAKVAGKSDEKEPMGTTKKPGKAICIEFSVDEKNEGGKVEGVKAGIIEKQPRFFDRMRITLRDPNKDSLARVINEISILNRARGNENLCQLEHFAIYESKGIKKAFLCERAYIPDLFVKLFEKPVEYTPKQMFSMAKDALTGVHAFHQLGFVHKDLKPDNFLLTLKDRLVLADFDLSSKKGEGISSGTAGYFSPETFADHFMKAAVQIKDSKGMDVALGTADQLNQPFNDVWSVGMIIGDIIKSERTNDLFGLQSQYINSADEAEKKDILEDYLLHLNALQKLVPEDESKLPEKMEYLEVLVYIVRCLLRPIPTERISIPKALEIMERYEGKAEEDGAKTHL